MLEISRADASHGWCASLIIHHAHLIAQFSEEMPAGGVGRRSGCRDRGVVCAARQVERVAGGYRVSGDNSTFASGVDHSTWVMVGGLVRDGGAPEWSFFMIPPGDYTVRDTWYTAGMRGTGSNTIVTDNVFVPETQVLSA